MTKKMKAALTMILAHAAFTDTTEGQVRIAKMNNDIVNAAAAEIYFFDKILLMF